MCPMTDNIVLTLVATLGYAGLGIGMLMEFMGIPFPGELTLGFAGFLLWRGVLSFAPTLTVALGLSWVGSLVAYLLGARLGRPFLLKYGKYGGLNEKRISKVENLFNQHNIIILIFGRFISGVRPLSAYLAGMSGMPFFSFATISFIGTALWTSTFIFIGYYLGPGWEKIGPYAVSLGFVFLTLSIVVSLLFWIYRDKRRLIKTKN